MKKLLLIIVIFSTTILYSQEGLVRLSEENLHNFSPEDLLSLDRFGSFDISSDGNYLIYTVSTPDINSNSFSKDMFLMNLKTEKVTKFGEEDYNESSPYFSKDSKNIYFLSNKLGSNQVFITSVNNYSPKPITAISGGVSNLKVSPDNKYLSYTVETDVTETILEKYNKLDKANALKYSDLPARHWDTWEDDKYSHINIYDLDRNKADDIMKDEPYDSPLKPFGGSSEFNWSSDSREIAYTSKKVENYEKSTDSDIYLYDLNTGNTKNITDGMEGYEKHPSYSPDGNWIAFHSQERPGFEADRVRLMLYNRNSGEMSEVIKDFDYWVGGFVWSPDSKEIYYSAGIEGKVHLFKVNISTGNYKQLTDDITNDDSGLAISSDNKTIFFGRRSMKYPTDLCKMEISSGNVQRLTRLNDNKLMKIKDIQINEEWIETTDGEKMHTWILLPPDFDENKKYPMLTYCQGGPQGTISNYFSYRWNLFLMASQGYVVCAPNRRGMPGFGQEWNDEISKDWGGQAMEDILAATDYVSAKKYVDNKNIAAVGASFGGYTVFWLEGHHEQRFKAFISHCGVFNLTSMYGSTEELFFPNWEFGGPYWDDDNEDIYEDFSPHNYVENWDTPILIITGMKDFRVPYTQSLEAYTAAQVKGIESDLLVFPDESHWVLNLQNALIWQNEFFEFLAKYLK